MFTRESIHHAYVLCGDKEIIVSELSDLLLRELGVARQSNPDFFYEEFENFGVDDSRRIHTMQTYRGFSGARKIFILSVSSMTFEAQNALLKVFEEPTEGTHFFIVTPSVEKFLPTLLSRVVLIHHGSQYLRSASGNDSVCRFLSSHPAERLAFVKEMLDSKDRAEISAFLSRTLSYLHAILVVKKMSPEGTVLYEDLIRFSSYIGDRSSSPKLILEHISLVLPKV